VDELSGHFYFPNKHPEKWDPSDQSASAPLTPDSPRRGVSGCRKIALCLPMQENRESVLLSGKCPKTDGHPEEF